MGFSNNRRTFKQAKQLCEKNGGNIPYSIQSSQSSSPIDEEWHWLNYPAKDNTCLAIRPGRYQEGASYFPCEYKFNIACQQANTFSLTAPSPPKTVSLPSPSQYNYNYLPRQTESGKGRWVGCQQPYKWMGKRCIKYSQNVPQWGVNFSNNRRSFKQAQRLCEKNGGNLPYSFLHSEPGRNIGRQWHWLNYPRVGKQCLAIRPGRYQDGAAYFPCEYKFNIACQQANSLPITVPPPPTIVRVDNPGQYNLFK